MHIAKPVYLHIPIPKGYACTGIALQLNLHPASGAINPSGWAS
ncbi:hypothetical protein [Pontibacter indicus]|nr:hypothetical protein [Pontibacter indicus]